MVSSVGQIQRMVSLLQGVVVHGRCSRYGQYAKSVPSAQCLVIVAAFTCGIKLQGYAPSVRW
jgi:hypothetical protein